MGTNWISEWRGHGLRGFDLGYVWLTHTFRALGGGTKINSSVDILNLRCLRHPSGNVQLSSWTHILAKLEERFGLGV